MAEYRRLLPYTGYRKLPSYNGKDHRVPTTVADHGTVGAPEEQSPDGPQRHRMKVEIYQRIRELNDAAEATYDSHTGSYDTTLCAQYEAEVRRLESLLQEISS